MSIESDAIAAIEEHGLSAKGRGELIKYLNGEKCTQRQAILAKCYDCMGYYADGKVDCCIKRCPLYPYSPYSSKPAAKRVLSVEQKQKASVNLAKHRTKRTV